MFQVKHHRNYLIVITGSFLRQRRASFFPPLAVADGVVVQKVLPDTSACAEGVKSGDIFTEVDSKPVRELKLPDVGHRLRGPVGSRGRVDIVAEGTG